MVTYRSSIENCTRVAIWYEYNAINYGSFLVMKIAGVKRNINDKTLTIPTPINATMNADYDGDFLRSINVKMVA